MEVLPEPGGNQPDGKHEVLKKDGWKPWIRFGGFRRSSFNVEKHSFNNVS